MDKLRQIDTRWGYNAKPNRGPGDNGGRAVVAAGDEILYNWGSNPDEGNTNEVYAVDMLVAHCGDKSSPPVSPSLTWRVFTGEEPVRWTGAGRFKSRARAPGPGVGQNEKRLRAAGHRGPSCISG